MSTICLARLDESELLMLVSDILSQPVDEVTPLQELELRAINDELELRCKALQDDRMEEQPQGGGLGEDGKEVMRMSKRLWLVEHSLDIVGGCLVVMTLAAVFIPN